MIRTTAFLIVCACASGAAAGLCDRAAPGLIYAACDGARGELRLLPEDAGPTPQGALDLTGAYTATDLRADGRPKPVGLFVRGGEIISREYVRFDGVLTIENASPQLHYRRAVRLADQIYDLEKPAERAAFLDAAADAGAAVMQSHLLIIDGEVDTAPIDGAPRFRRRILFETADGEIGVYDTSPRAVTLDEAAREVAETFSPSMALNLDMGSYDFCRRGGELCGALAPAQTAKLSNLLRLR